MVHAATLEQLLAERERRWNARLRLAASSGCPVLSLTLNIPGPNKNLPGVEAALAELRAALCSAVAATGGQNELAEEQMLQGPDGPCWLAAVRMEPRALKAAAVGVEEGHPLGRLADADVMDSHGQPVNRADLGHAPRACFLCARPASLCRREGRHSPQELHDAVCALLRDRTANAGGAPCLP